MNPLVATKTTSSKSTPGGIPGKLGPLVLAALLCLASGAFAAGDASVTLAWNANPEPTVAGYRLMYGTDTGSYPNSVDAGNTTTATADGLVSGTTYKFVVVAYDSQGLTSPPSSVVSYTVPGPPNTAPTANPFLLTVLEDGQAAATLSGSDAENNGLTFSVVAAPAKGTLTGTPPNLTYRPAANANGSDSFTYRANDGALNSPNATVTISITAVSDAPVATASSVTTQEDTQVPVVLSGTDADGDSLTYSIVTAPTKGTLAGTPPNLTYQPASNLSGSDGFTFRVYDGAVFSTAATVSISITAVNDAPVAIAKSVTVTEDTAVAVTLAGTDVEGSSLTYTILAQPVKGALSGTPPNVIYTPGLNATGADSFTFRVRDGSADSAAATVSLNITAVNDPPVAVAKTVSTPLNTALPIALTGTDVEGSSLTYAVVTQPAHGTLGGSPPSLIYTPASGYSGPDSFTFRVNDGSVNSANATISVSVSAGNTPPVAAARTLSTSEDTNVSATLSGTDAENDSLTFTVLTNPSKGTLAGTPPNLTYRPNPNANGSDSFTFRVNDGKVNSAAATVGISISAVNDAPVANAKSVTTGKNAPVAVVLAGTDIEASPLTYTVLTSPAIGVLSGTAPNLTYTPNFNASGADSFTFRVNDGAANSGAATVSINITNNNQVPQAHVKSLPVLKNRTLAIVLSGSDADANPLTFRVTSQPSSGVLTGTAPKLSFKPATGFTGNASFTYVVNDGFVDSAPATVTVRVKPANKKPVATARTMVANQNVTTAVVLTGTDPDADPLSFAVVRQPRNGTLTGTPPNLIYRPNTGYRGPDSFTFLANDGLLKSTAATVTISVVNPSNRAPVSANWSVGTAVGKAVPVILRATDADGDPMTYRVVGKPAKGTLGGRAPNLSFRPAFRFVGTVSFTYVANDGQVDSAPVTVTVNVTAPGVVAAATAGGAATLPQLSLQMDPARPGVVSMKIIGVPGESYVLEHSPDLSIWAEEEEVMIDATGSRNMEMPVPVGATAGFYRLRTP